MSQNGTVHESRTFIKGIWRVEGLIIVVVNSMALAVFLSKTFRIKKSSYLFVNLSIADLQVGLTLIINGIYGIAYDNVDKDLPYIIPMNRTSVISSLYTLSAIAIENAYAIFAPFKHRLLGKMPYIFAIALTWIVPILTLLISRMLFELKVWLTIQMSFAIGALGIVFGCYLAIWIKAKYASPFANNRPVNNKLTVTLFLITLLSFLCYLPYAAFSLYDSWHEIDVLDDDHFQGLMYASSFLNFLAYSFRMPEFRKELCQFFCKCCLRRSVAASVQVEVPLRSNREGQPSVISLNVVTSVEQEESRGNPKGMPGGKAVVTVFISSLMILVVMDVIFHDRDSGNIDSQDIFRGSQIDRHEHSKGDAYRGAFSVAKIENIYRQREK
ncbi:predicted protein [Nematostella vectensis]|uniref:G-protein coupled receptors family 1 profile domain-containing protein n=1 Tax=Nematostella vectensis TaxID=45351 RepID=A7RKK1_NEMVE|nr:predicted protein [Nematostella vectensis]|eukprot:XP_001640064.1 predicted protein [Nematostella vectensis]